MLRRRMMTPVGRFSALTLKRFSSRMVRSAVKMLFFFALPTQRLNDAGLWGWTVSQIENVICVGNNFVGHK
jgi:hypothetical protein